MTAKDMMDLIGKVGSLTLDGFVIDMKVLDARTRWGQIDCLVEPVHGAGSRWVESGRLKGLGQ